MTKLPIKVQIPFKPKIILVLLLTVAAMNALSLFFFTHVDAIVHRDLYNYGLQFSHEWADKYWTLSSWLLNSLIMAITFISLSIVSISIYTHTNSNISRLVCHLFLVAAIALTLFSAFVFTNLDHIIHSDLYRYGLQFSYEWATNYWTNARLMLGLTGFSTVINLFSLTLIFLGTRGQVRIDLTKLTYSTLIATGAIALILSTIYNSSILAFIGLGLTFWGIILAYIRTEEYVKENLLEATTLPSLETLNQILKELDYKGKAVYLPPKYLTTPEENKAYIPKQEEEKLPTPEQTQKQETKIFLENPNGILLTPPGAELAKLFEKTLETSFTRVDLQYLQQNMPKLFIEDLEIAQNFDMTIENNKIHIKIQNSAYKNLNKEAENLSNLYTSLGSPISSAIACALAKASGKPIIIERQHTSEDGKTIEIEYQILEGEETEQ